MGVAGPGTLEAQEMAIDAVGPAGAGQGKLPKEVVRALGLGEWWVRFPGLL